MLINKVKNRFAWIIRKIKKYYSLFYKNCIDIEGRYSLARFFPDSLYLKLAYKKRVHEKLHLKCPKTFNEKIQWLKIHDRRPVYTTMVDKYLVKKYIADLIGEEYVIPTLGVWNRYEDIDFDSLPDKFVLKCTHDSGSVVICHDKKSFRKEEYKEYFNKRLTFNYYKYSREWPYKNVKPRIIAEEYMEDSKTKELRDYKFYCFDGYIKALLLASNRQSKTKELCFDYFDENYNHLNIKNHWHPNAEETPEKPLQFELMKMMARKLSTGIPHVRVDFYESNGKVYFGEFTFSDMGGFLILHPDSWNREWGELIKLPKK